VNLRLRLMNVGGILMPCKQSDSSKPSLKPAAPRRAPGPTTPRRSSGRRAQPGGELGRESARAARSAGSSARSRSIAFDTRATVTPCSGRWTTSMASPARARRPPARSAGTPRAGQAHEGPREARVARAGAELGAGHGRPRDGELGVARAPALAEPGARTGRVP